MTRSPSTSLSVASSGAMIKCQAEFTAPPRRRFDEVAVIITSSLEFPGVVLAKIANSRNTRLANIWCEEYLLIPIKELASEACVVLLALL